MKEKKNIDRLFQEKFKNFEAHPSDRVWNNIVAAQKKGDNRKVIPLWWKLGGIAAALMLLFGLGTVLFSNDTAIDSLLVEETNTIENSSSKSDDENLDRIVSQDANTTSSNESTISKQEDDSHRNKEARNGVASTSTTNIGLNNRSIDALKEKQRQETKANNTADDKGLIASQNNVQIKNLSSTANPTTNGTKASKEMNAGPPSDNIESKLNDSALIAQASPLEEKKDLVAEAQKIEVSKEEDALVQVDEETSLDRWDVGAVAAPVYYGDFGGSGLDKQFADNNKSGDVNLSYGVQVSYALTPRFKIRTGVSNVDLSYNTNEISFSTNGLGRRIRGVAYSDNARTLAIADNSNGENNLAADNLIPSVGITADGSLQQQLSYLEVPLEAIYVISDKRIGLSVVGGMSTLFLNDNDVVLRSPELTTNLGTASGVNEISFTTNIGIGLDYKVTDKVIFNIEPSLKYQLNSFDNSVVDFKPYYLGLYTGISYKF